ncbi:HD domain-containing protein [Candidatus Falkowbacteria bacterium]|jgi:3'-5' exoribonuclease|nr:HD domain-containing protein [Candidatus Falkowbacteria bacterium]MBT7006903.1 HD domain-containing protein [Candidatus Falkowbacteria bacterium]
MKETFIKDLQFGDNITNEQFAVKSVKKGKTMNGKDFYDLTLTDKSGEIFGKIWEDKIPNCQETKEGDIIELSGKISEFKDKAQLVISFLQVVDDFEVENFLPTTDKDIEAMWKKLKKFITEIKDKNIKELINYFFTKKEFTEKFKKAPAAEFIHHAYIGGLVEHTLEMLELSKVVKDFSPEIDSDLLTAGILLHDVGKLEELAVEHTITRTLPGSLVGHIPLGSITVNRAVAQLKDFPEDLHAKILHLVLSHHGKLEYGSPVKPAIPEAFALSYIDGLSAKVNTAVKVKKENDNGNVDFSNYNFALENKLYLK